MRNIPQQIEKFMEIQHFDFDNSNAFLHSPDPTNLSSSSSQPLSQNGEILSPTVTKVSPVNAAGGTPSKEQADNSSNGQSKLTVDNLAKRDSLMMMDEEAKQNLRQEIEQQQNHHEQEDQLNYRLKQVNLEIGQEDEEETKQAAVPVTSINASQTEEQLVRNINVAMLQQSKEQSPTICQPDYKKPIHLFLEMEKIKLVSRAMAAGIPESEAQEALQEESFIDFSLENLQEIIKRRRQEKLQQ